MRSGLKFELIQLLKVSNTVECLTQQQCEALPLFSCCQGGVILFHTLQEKERRQLSKEWKSNPEVTEIFLVIRSLFDSQKKG